MSSGSTFTLYRKYNLKAESALYDKVIAAYIKTNKEHDYSDKKDKSDLEYANDIPLVLDCNHGIKESTYDDQTKKWTDLRDHSVEGQRNKFKFILKSDGSHLDQLLEWNFCSNFTCLKNEWNLNTYNYKDNQHMVDKLTAESMLQACNYLLSGKWSDEFEVILNNRWIKIFADGNDCASYWKYIYRNNKKRLKEIQSEDDYDNEEVEWQLKRLKGILETFVGADEDYSDDKTELMLVYSAW